MIQGGIFVFLVFLAVVSGVFAIGQGYLIATIVDQVFIQGEGLQLLWALFWLLLAVFIGRGIISFLTTKIGVRLASIVKVSLRRRLIYKLAEASPNRLFRYKTGQIISVLTDGIDNIDAYYSKYLPQLLQAAIIPPMILLAVFMHNVYSGLIMLITAPLIPVFMNLIGNMADNKARQQFDSLMTFSGHFLDILQGLTTLKIFGNSKRQRQNIVKMSDNFRDTTMEVLKVAFLSALMLEILATISTAMIAVEVGLRLVYSQLTFKTAFFVLLLAPELYLPLKNLGSSFHSGKNSIAAAKQVWQILDEPVSEIKWGDKSFTEFVDEKIYYPKIYVENVSFSYYDNRPILRDINFEIQSRQRVAIVGKSGSGKTTLLKILLGILPASDGRIMVNGIPLSEYNQDAWISHVAYVSQEPYLFAGTIADNIAIGRSEASFEEIGQAAKLAGVNLFIEELADGYNTIVGEGGRGLSGGEKQRVALARAFLKQASIVVLDEPTAGLDLETEHVLKAALHTLSENATVITVAHRLQTVIDADVIVLLSDGQVIATGAHEELLDKSDLYRELVSVYRGDQL